MDKIIIVECSGANIVLIAAAFLIFFRIRIAYNVKQWLCLLSWLVLSIVAIVADWYLYFKESEKSISVMLFSLCVLVPLNIVFAQRAFRNYPAAEAYVYVAKKALYLILIVVSLVQMFMGYERLGVIATGLGITFAIFEFADMKLETKKADEK